jgi:3-dehydroquinate dehydratase
MEYLGIRQPELYGTTTARETRRPSDEARPNLTSQAAIGVIMGFGIESYLLALQAMARRPKP